MITDTTMLYLYVETPLHAGAGSGLSSIDMPIQRERVTQYPMIQGSGIKGKLRASAGDAWNPKEVALVFGPDNDGAEHAGALIVGDARILLFPVRSLSGVFSYITSRDVLSRFLRDYNRRGNDLFWNIVHDLDIPDHTALVPTKNSITAEGALVLEEFSFDARPDEKVSELGRWLAEYAFPQSPEYDYWRKKVKDSLVLLPDNDFRDFVVNSTEIVTRIRIDRQTRTVDRGALWTEEHLPTDTVLYVPVYATNSRKARNGNDDVELAAADILNKVRSLTESQKGYIQLGGDETIGRGIVCMSWAREER
ncbi:type III-B CRISPR module RAMP protein Cmr4 [Dictyobacter arantiisoli]|uniref:Type III-B CRISPR module RAMP protein Cmr4 n=1 Tax=Dictyobacter arantiisoli TaxID=2014874 RepID=A0A5A5TKE8_9CHLR|nr:type III-B CRISPR module RAMP protein Cmr4 [Dictyobacter arantiisoli]GCF11708.1 type III-B CRISPR module RAMP protein Cmr4 [Dictyobacter arantiisoli]